MEKDILVSVCLLVNYKFRVCMSLSKDVNAENKGSIIWLLFCTGVTRSVSHEQKTLQGLSKILGQISGMSYSHKRMKKIPVRKLILGTAHTFL